MCLLSVRGRSSVGAFQKWAEEVGDEGYTFDNLLPFFKKSISFTSPASSKINPNVSLPLEENVIASGGPLQVSYPRYFNTVSSWLGKAFGEIGFQRLPGFFDGRLFGWSYFPYTVDPKTQTRSSSATSFLRQGLRQSNNLYVYKSTLVKKVLLDDCRIASGVAVSTAGVDFVINATKEVILSAGAVSCMTSFVMSRID